MELLSLPSLVFCPWNTQEDHFLPNVQPVRGINGIEGISVLQVYFLVLFL